MATRPKRFHVCADRKNPCEKCKRRVAEVAQIKRSMGRFAVLALLDTAARYEREDASEINA